MFFDKVVLAEVLGEALRTGGDFSEIFMEEVTHNSLQMVDEKIDTATNLKTFGAGIRVLKGTNSVYATTNDLTREGLLSCALRAALGIGEISSVKKDISLVERTETNIHRIKYNPSDVSVKRKTAILRESYAVMTEHDKRIIQAVVGLAEREQNVLIANSEGLYTTDKRVYSRMRMMAVASDGIQNQTGVESPGKMRGFELFTEEIDPKIYAKQAAKQAITMLSAKDCPAGKMTVAIDNGFGGVIFHEACGHSLEATAVGKGNSVFCDKLGTKIANEKITAIDDGTIPNEWGSINIDDEGEKSQYNLLIENGILKGYLIDRLGSIRMGMPSTGSSRRESYQYAPTSRMTNTMILNGPDKNEDIIASIDDGLYAKKMGGGSVNPETGEFNFAVTEGYLVKNGKIMEPVRGAVLIGKGHEILMDIDMVGQNLEVAAGVCGSLSGSVNTNVGQPMVRVSSITVGGR